MTTSDVICSRRYRSQIIDFTKHQADMLIANRAEIFELFNVSTIESAIKNVRGLTSVGVITCGEDGSYVFSDTEVWQIPAVRVDKVIDVTGAGDAYAGGFLYGYSKGLDLPVCGQMGAEAAGKIISQYGARAVF
jgi:fructokinase